MINRYIDLGNPVNDTHPLNKGLTAWFLPLANNKGGYSLFDLRGRRYNGTLANNPLWVERSPPETFALRYDGSTNYTSFPAVSLSGTGSIALWFRPRSAFASGDHPLFTLRSNFAGLTLLLDFYASGGTLYCGWYHSGGAGEKRATWAISGITTGTWNHAAMTWADGISTTIHINGVLVTTGADGGGSMWDTTLGTPYQGTAQLHGTVYANDDITDMRWYDRQVSASEIGALYQESMAGYPTALRRWSPMSRLLVKPPVAVPASTAALGGGFPIRRTYRPRPFAPGFGK